MNINQAAAIPMQTDIGTFHQRYARNAEQQIKRMHSLIDALLSQLEEDIASPDGDADNGRRARREWLWGTKESAVSVLHQLTQMLVKIVSLEQSQLADMAKEHGGVPAAPREEIKEVDWDILERYIAKRKQRHGE